MREQRYKLVCKPPKIIAFFLFIASKYTIDRQRIYCCGFSNGGMMTYTVANLLGDVFAAYASISGYPINEFHLHHTGARPVPFLHIHGTNDDLVKSAYVSKIIDNMVARNGCNPVPEETKKSGKFTKKVYQAGEGGFPIVFYSINGMGHSPETNANANVYPSLQFIAGNYRLTFNAIGEAGKQVTVSLKRLAGKKDVVFEQNVEVGENRAIDFSIPDEWAEFNVTFSKADEADDIKITGIEIHSIDSNPDAINDIRTDAASHAKGIYNLNGIRTNHPTPGINIIDGKKVVIK